MANTFAMLGLKIEFVNYLEKMKGTKYVLHIGWRMEHDDATDIDMSIYQLAADVVLEA